MLSWQKSNIADNNIINKLPRRELMKLIILKNYLVEGVYELDDFRKDVITIGRKNDCDIVVPDSFISSLHCIVYKEGNSWKIQDMESRNGIYLENNRVFERHIHSGDSYTVNAGSDTRFEFAFQESIPDVEKEQVKPRADASLNSTSGSVSQYNTAHNVPQYNTVNSVPQYNHQYDAHNNPPRKKFNVFLPVMASLILIVTIVISVVALVKYFGKDKDKEAEEDVLELAFDGDDDYEYHFQREDENLSNIEAAKIWTDMEKPKDSVSNTVMIYLVGSSLESEAGTASYDIEEMCESGVDTDNTNVVFFTGGCRQWWLNDISSGHNGVFRVEDGYFREEGYTYRLLNMGEASTLLGFLDFCKEYYPAEHYSLIMWDHGAGPILGFGADEMFGDDSLTFREISLALDESGFSGDNKLDIIGFDACLMGSIEYAKLFNDYAKIYVSSQEAEPGCGWNYSYLKKYNTTSDPKQIACEIVDSYADYCDLAFSVYGNIQYTLSAVDLSKTNDTVQSLDTFFGALNNSLENGEYSQIIKNRENVMCYGLAAYGQKGDSIDSVDLGSMCDEYYGNYPVEAGQLNQSINDMVIYQRTNIPGSSGLSIYFPYDNQNVFYYYGQSEIEHNFLSQNYVDFMNNFSVAWNDEQYNTSYMFGYRNENADVSGEDIGNQENSYPELVSNGDELILALSDEQDANISEAYYSILKKVDIGVNEESYMPIMKDIYIEPDSNGIIHINNDINNIYISTENDEICLYYNQYNHTPNADYYNCKVALSDYPVMSTGRRLYDTFVYINIREENGEFYLESIIPESVTEEEKRVGKNNINIEDYKYMEFVQYSIKPTYDDNGYLVELDDWVRPDVVYTEYDALALDADFMFKKVSLSDEEDDYYCMVTLVDTQGRTYNTSLVPVGEKKNFTAFEYNTDNGKLQCIEKNNEVLIKSYEGNDKEIVIPESIDDHPVVEIREEAFYNNTGIEHIVIPKSVTRIGRSAFERCENLNSVELFEGLQEIDDSAFLGCSSLRSIQLPDSLERIGDNAFNYLEDISITIPKNTEYIGIKSFGSDINLDISKDNHYFKMEDRALFTYDGKKLIDYYGDDLDYTIPEGVEIIGTSAFEYVWDSDADLVIPEGVKEIEAFAFYHIHLNKIVLPASCETLGVMSFGNSEINNIEIGSGLKTIAGDTFEMATISQIDVSKNNANYKSEDGFLLTKNGEVLIFASSDMEGEVYVPNGVVTIENSDVFSSLNIEKLYLSDSVILFDSDSIRGSLEELYIGSSLTCWENKNSISGLKKIDVSSDNEYFTDVDGIVYSKDKKQLLAVPCHWDGGNTLIIEDGTVELKYFGGNINETIEKIEVPGSVESIWGRTERGTFFNCFDSLKEVEIASDNAKFMSEDGLVYSKDGTRLYAVPLSIGSVVKIKDGTQVIMQEAFADNSFSDRADNICVEEIYLPESMERIEDWNYNYVSEFDLPENIKLKVYIPEGVSYIAETSFHRCNDLVVFYGKKGSYAENIAKTRNIEFIEE